MRSFVIPFSLLILLLFAFVACGEDSNEASTDDSGGSSDIVAPGADDDESGEPDDAATGDVMYAPPLGSNPALGYGPYKVVREFRHINDGDEEKGTFYVYRPQDLAGPYPTIIWGHGIMASNRPSTQSEIYVRLASRGFLVIYPNLEVPFPFIHDDTVARSLRIYLRAARQAVARGLADPDRIIFGGFSYGGRVAALATAWTGKLDPLDLWPNPVACVYEAMADFNREIGLPYEIPGPRAVDYVDYIDPTIPQTVIVAKDDILCRNYGQGDQPLNGMLFYQKLETNFAQLIVLQPGSTWQDRATHATFLMRNAQTLNAQDLWGHFKIIAGMMQYHFHGHSRHWAYGSMRSVGGLDHEGKIIIHEVYERGDLFPGSDDGDESIGEEPSGEEIGTEQQNPDGPGAAEPDLENPPAD